MLSPSNTNGSDIVSVLDILPSEFRYNSFSILGSFKFLDGIGTLISNDELNGTSTSFTNSKSPGNPSDFCNTFILLTIPVIGSTFEKLRFAKFLLFCVDTLEPLWIYSIE